MRDLGYTVGREPLPISASLPGFAAHMLAGIAARHDPRFDAAVSVWQPSIAELFALPAVPAALAVVVASFHPPVLIRHSWLPPGEAADSTAYGSVACNPILPSLC